MSLIDKRYQVFISSTYADLKEERREVMQAIMEMDCIPAGMELFPALDEEQFKFIKRVIDDCDYYLLIIGGRYGSLSAEGISYTEAEYNYAIEKDKKVIALIRKDIDAILYNKSENNPDLRTKLDDFRRKVSSGRLVRFWTSSGELPGLVVTSLNRTIKTYPAVGWVRGNTVASRELLEQVNELRIENEQLRSENARLKELDAQERKVEITVNHLLSEEVTVGLIIGSDVGPTWPECIRVSYALILARYAQQLAVGVESGELMREYLYNDIIDPKCHIVSIDKFEYWNFLSDFVVWDILHVEITEITPPPDQYRSIPIYRNSRTKRTYMLTPFGATITRKLIALYGEVPMKSDIEKLSSDKFYFL